jgi:hypothetical protein
MTPLGADPGLAIETAPFDRSGTLSVRGRECDSTRATTTGNPADARGARPEPGTALPIKAG